MRARITIDVPDDFLEARAARHRADHGAPSFTGAELFASRLRDVADDELPLALWGWPAEITVEVDPG